MTPPRAYFFYELCCAHHAFWLVSYQRFWEQVALVAMLTATESDMGEDWVRNGLLTGFDA